MILYEKGSTTAEASGTTFTLQDTSNERKLSFKKYYGDTQQSGTPTPSSPQPINVVTGGNTISVVGKNLFSGEYSQFVSVGGTGTTYDYFKLPKEDTKYTLTLIAKKSFTGNSRTYIGFTKNGGNSSGGTYFALNAQSSFTAGQKISISNLVSNTYYNYVSVFTNEVNWETIIDSFYIQLEEGNETEYEQYKGTDYHIDLDKNVFDKESSGITTGKYLLNDGSLISGSAWSVSDYIEIQSNTTYKTNAENTLETNPSRCYYDSNKTFISGVKHNGSNPFIDTSPSNAKYMRESYQTNDLDSVTITYNAIELNKINTYQDTIFKSSGKNLIDTIAYNKSCDASGVIANAGTPNNYLSINDYVEVKPNTTYTISFQKENGGYMYVSEKDINGSFIRRTMLSENVRTFTTGNTTYQIFVFIYKSGGSYANVGGLVQLEYGSQSTQIEPYGTQWYIKKSIGKVVLDGSEDENWGVSTATHEGFTRFNSSSMPQIKTGNLAICNHFLIGSTSSTTTSNLLDYRTPNQILINTDVASTLANFKTWLSTHNTIVYYVLNTPTYTKITDEELLGQIEALENATTYDNVTNILQSNTDLPLYVDIEYLKPLDFSRNGLGYLPNVLNAYVTDEINGEYSLTFEYPIEDRMASEIVEDRIVKCKVADGSNQCFIIKKIQKNFDKMSVYCTHLFYMLYDDFLEDTYPQNLSPKPFLDHILSRANYQLPFVANSDIATSKTARYVRKNVVETILGNINNSMYNLWGLELKRDNWNIGLKARLGADKGEKLIFGKNITGVDVSVDTTGIYTRIMPIGFDGLLLPEKYIDAPNINEYPYPRICLYEFSNIRYDANEEDTEAYHTLDEAYQALRDAVQELFDKGINKPKINIKVDWLELSKTEEFKQYSALERVDLGDTLTSNLFGMDYETRVIKTIYNPLNDRIEQFEIGTFKPSITTEMNQLNFDVINLPSSMLDEAQANATQLITQAMGGYIYKTNSELYIMDNPDPAQAVKVWRWNINGLGYSSTGINGTYGIAMTMDGSIVADFITTGQLNTGVIEGYDSLVTTVNGNGIKIDNNYQELLGMFGNYTPTSTTTELQSKVTNLQTNTYTKQQIDTKLVDGSVQKVMTTSGTFDINGMHYERTNAQTKTTINEVGVGVRKTDGTDDYILFAGYVNPNNSQFSDYEGQTIVASENILVKNYLVIGNNSRMENYENGTGVFYIGG